MAGITTISIAALAGTWLATAANAFGFLGAPLPLPRLNTTLAILIVVSLLVGIWRLVRGPSFYRAMKVGEAVAEERARRRAVRTPATSGSRMEVTG